MKIAAITDDGKTISQHFGRASHYMVITLEEGKIIEHELREKLSHAQFQAEGHEQEHGHPANGQHGHGHGPEADQRHGRMAEAITDCEAILCRGMGMGAYESMKARNIRPVVTDISSIDEAALAYASQQIVDHIEKLH